MKDVAVIVINFNTSRFTLDCIQSVVEHTDASISYDIIVVDNNSERDDYQYLKTNFPNQENIKLYRSEINTGFGGGNMHGAQYANAKYLLFLNNDAMFLNNCLSILFSYMESHPKIGVSTAQNYDEHQKFVPSFDHFKGLRRLLFGRGFLEKINTSLYPNRKKEYTQPLKVNWVNGAFMFFRADAFNSVEGFDTNIFLYYEEMDICYRLRNQKYSSVLIPEAKILHYQGASTGSSKVLSKESYISYLYVIQKNYGKLKAFIIRLYLILVMSLKPKKWYILSLLINPKMNSESLRLKQ
jgi:hypothetical protein